MIVEDAHIEEALRIAHLPRKYKDKTMTLEGYGKPGEELKKWIKATASTDIAGGRGLFFVGDDPLQLDMFYLTLRGLLITRHRVLTLPLSVIARAYQDAELREQMDEVDVFAISGFYNSHYPTAYQAEALLSLEWVIRRRMLDGKSLFLQSTNPIMQCKWWSPGLLHLVENHCQVIA